MEFYPLGRTDFATRVTTASIALTGSFLTIPVVPTSSTATNRPGPQGPSGSTFTFTGVTGPAGPQGPSGSQGFGVYLLAAARRAFCGYTFTLGSSLVGPGTACNRYNSSLTEEYYSNDSSLTLGDPLYTELVANPPTASNGYYADATNYWVVTGGFVSAPNLCSSCSELGASCTDNSECCSGNCASGTCGPEV
jgi:hypothetical protein